MLSQLWVLRVRSQGIIDGALLDGWTEIVVVSDAQKKGFTMVIVGSGKRTGTGEVLLEKRIPKKRKRVPSNSDVNKMTELA